MYEFRAWDIESPAMLSWDEIQDTWKSEGYYNNIFDEDHYICMQYTNKNDEFNNKVFDKDIIETHLGQIGYVYLNSGCWMVHWYKGEINDYDSFLFKCCNFKIIGNQIQGR